MKFPAFVVIVTFSILTVSPDAFSFDGTRKGFVIGGGVGHGFGGYSQWSSDIPESNDSLRSKPSKFPDLGYKTALSLVVGWGLSVNNLLTLEMNDSWISGGDERTNPNYAIVNWYHYFGGESRSIFTSVGAGLGRFADSSLTNQWGGAGQIGIGYQFARHLNVGANIRIGATTFHREDGTYYYRHGQLSLLFGYVAY